MFLSIIVDDKMITKAIKIREKRDKQYGNIYDEVETDLRWVGDLGEICFNDWLKRNGVVDFEWHLDNAAGKPDFTLKNVRIDVKTVKRKVQPRIDYTAQITAKHKDAEVDQLFFCSYQFQIKKMWFLGGIAKTDFIKKARYYKAGDHVHEHYVIRVGHEIYNAPISVLSEPNEWIKFIHN